MKVLIPNTGSVFLREFDLLEELFHEPTSLYPALLSPEELWTAEAAYKGWWRIRQQLSPALEACSCRPCLPEQDAEHTSAARRQDLLSTCTWTCLHVVVIDSADVAAMELFLAECQREDSNLRSEELTEIPVSRDPLVDGLKRILATLRIQPPSGLAEVF
ncbi:hypothetical protein [Streptomyces sp. NPDC059631]|uniref:hypothetical protein n=1 Tax=unclassified Streptomyces TaxID=2593676 RepID=UPI0036806C11